MKELLDIIIVLTAYSHDIATATLASAALGMWLLSTRWSGSESSETQRFYIRIYEGITRAAKDSLYWILLAGVPRILMYKKYEWYEPAGELQVVAIIIKHVAMFALVGGGLYYWLRLARRVKFLRLTHGTV